MREMEQSDHDADGVVIEAKAVDGLPAPRKAVTVADTLRLLNDGEFDVEASHLLRQLVQKMEAFAFTNRGVAKGKMTIELDVTLANGAHTVVPSIKIRTPEPVHVGTVLFAHEDGGLSRNPPGQGVFFGVRDVSGATPVRTV